MAENRSQIIALCGPTASGKTRLSLELAERMNAEIVSCDSMQIYRGMDIGTAKASASERARVPHHLIDVVSPLEAYSTEAYRHAAEAAIRDIVSRGKSVLIVGGTGLYLDTLKRKESFDVPRAEPEYRERILSELDGAADIHALWERLREVDPESAEAIHENNVRRVIRALEIYDKTGKPKSYFDKLSRSAETDFKIKVIALAYHSRESLYERINARVDEMLESGLLSEVRSLYENGLLKDGTTASQAIGYKELISYIKGEGTLEAAVEDIKLSSRRYAKRQETWFRHVDALRIMLDFEDGAPRPFQDVLEESLSAVKNEN